MANFAFKTFLYLGRTHRIAIKYTCLLIFPININFIHNNDSLPENTITNT